MGAWVAQMTSAGLQLHGSPESSLYLCDDQYKTVHQCLCSDVTH